MKLLFKKDNKQLFEKNWNSFIKQSLVSYNYTLLKNKYSLSYISNLTDDLSFIYTENNKAKGITFLPVEKKGKIKTISIREGYVPKPFALNKRIEKIIFKKIDILSKKHNIALIKFYIDPLLTYKKQNHNSLLKYGFVDSSSTDCIIDLKKPQEVLWSNLRESHKRNIKKIKKDKSFAIEIVDYKKLNKKTHDLYEKLHHKCAGKVTRNKNTFDLQYEMLKKDRAAIFCLKYKKKYIGLLYFFHFKNGVCYASGADDPKFDHFPIYHITIWNACKYYKKRGLRLLKLSGPNGFNEIDGFNNYFSQKQINIGHFKRGFKGEIITAYRGIKYYDKKELLKDINNFKKEIKGN